MTLFLFLDRSRSTVVVNNGTYKYPYHLFFMPFLRPCSAALLGLALQLANSVSYDDTADSNSLSDPRCNPDLITVWSVKHLIGVRWQDEHTKKIAGRAFVTLLPRFA